MRAARYYAILNAQDISKSEEKLRVAERLDMRLELATSLPARLPS
jgi:hypothetical protein